MSEFKYILAQAEEDGHINLCQLYSLAKAAGVQQAIEVADKERLRIANRYDKLTDAGEARMTGNMEWAMLEGAVKVVQQLRSLKLKYQYTSLTAMLL